MASLLVTIGTDGLKDWVRTPDGQKLSLGGVSALTFVAKLTRNSRVAQQALDEFLTTGEAMVAVDDDRMWALLAPVRARWASAGPFMPGRDGDLSSKEPSMSTIKEDLGAVQRAIGHLNRLASQGRRDPNAVHDLIKLADKIKSPNQSTNTTYYGLGEAKVFEVGDAAPKPHTVKAAGDLAFDVYEANMKVAQDILAKSQETVSTISRLASQGKRFNAARARADVARVTTTVASICSKTELTESWVHGDLARLGAQSDRLYRLFHPRGA